MNAEQISKITRKYFLNTLTDDVKNRFGQWLIGKHFNDEKERAMEELWLEESAHVNADAQTHMDLDNLHLRMRQSLPKRSKLPRYLRFAAATTLFIMGSFSSFLFLKTTTKKTGEVKMLHCFVPYGERKSIQLPDGSTANLNAGSLLVYPEEFLGNNRSLYLSGEAEFTVEKNRNKPFIVKTNHLEVEALGTVFTVTSFPEDSITQTMLEEGKVRVGIYNKDHDNRILQPNDLLTYSHNSKSITISKVDAVQHSEWKNGYLIFKNATISNIFKNMERCHNVTISYEIQKFGVGVYNVKFMPNETVEERLDVLNKLIDGFTIQKIGNTYLLTKK